MPAGRAHVSAATTGIIGATVAVSFSAIFITIANDDAATVVWLRMGFAVLLLAPWTLRGRTFRLQGADRRHALTVACSGVLLAGHFLLWTASLGYTSIAASVLLVSIHPLLVVPLGRRLLGDPATRALAFGAVLAVGGTAITCLGAASEGRQALIGDLLAVGGALCLAGYLLIGRALRGSTHTISYSATVYTVVCAVSGLTALLGKTAHVPSLRTTLCCLALAAVCTVGGHTVYNWALRRVGAGTVSVALLGEAPLTAVLALAIFGAVPAIPTLIGGVLILLGVGMTLASSSAGAATAPALD